MSALTRANLPTPDLVERQLSLGFPSLAFAPELECRYEDETRQARTAYLIRALQLGALLSDSLIVCDWIMIPDMFRTALVMRFGVFTVLFLIVWFVLRRNPTKLVRESVSAGFCFMAMVLTIWVAALSRSPDVAIYQYGIALNMVFGTVVQRLRFWYAVATIISLSFMQFFAVGHMEIATPKVMASIVIYYVTAGVLLVWAAYVLESEQRRSYLLDLRSRILNDHLDHIAKQDALTGLWNRRHLNAVMEAAWRDADLVAHDMSVILLDIDHFKAFNDSRGHIEGDKCLQCVGACVLGAIEANAVAVRFGGEEFLVFIDGADQAAARSVAERIQSLIKERAIPQATLGKGVVVTASFGIATGRAPDVSFERLVAAADEALYAAKRAGRDQIWPAVLHAESGVRSQARLPIAC